MVARSDYLDRTVEDTAATCQMLLSRVGHCVRGGGGESRVFRCKTCLKEFSSFQALGGHRASHRKPFNNSSGDEQSSLSSGSVAKKTKKDSSHTCPICGLEFPMGQALGGHMRKHRNAKENGALVTHSFMPEALTSTTFTTLKKSSSGKRVGCFDLGSDSMESMINLKLELGRTIY